MQLQSEAVFTTTLAPKTSRTHRRVIHLLLILLVESKAVKRIPIFGPVIFIQVIYVELFGQDMVTFTLVTFLLPANKVPDVLNGSFMDQIAYYPW